MAGIYARTQLMRRLGLRNGDSTPAGGLDHRLPPNRNETSLTHYDAMLEQEAMTADVPVELLKAICWYASGWRQYEPSGRVLSTPAAQGTSYGCMQLNDVWHPDAFPSAMHNAQSSVAYAARLLRWLYEQTDDWHRASIAFFGHDRRAENAARRVRKYADQQPWLQRQETEARSEPPLVGHRS